MTTQTAKLPRFFYRMPPRPCPYLGGRTEQNIFTELAGPNTPHLYDALTQAGFRRSHNVAYRPACPGCQACVPVRVVASQFSPGKSLKRVERRNADLLETVGPPRASAEQFRVFSRYVASRHGDGEMAGMSQMDYTAMVQDSPLKTYLVEYHRTVSDAEFASDGAGSDDRAGLVAACLVDRLTDGLSAVYSYFDPADAHRSLGTYVILRLIEQCRQAGLPYLYLGYWIAGSHKMAYKSRFKPLEGLGQNGWSRIA